MLVVADPLCCGDQRAAASARSVKLLLDKQPE
jgi:hypothetical protein